MRGLLILRGISFRDGGNSNFEFGSENSVEPQKQAWISHLKLLEQLQTKFDVKTEVLIDTVECNHSHLIKEIFSNFDYKLELQQKLDHNQRMSLKRLVNENLSFMKDFDYLIFSRNDVFLKDQLIDLINPFEEKIKFSFVAEYSWRKFDNKIPRVDDIVFFLPKKFFHILTFVNIGENNRKFKNSWHDLLWLMMLKDPQIDYDFYVNTYHCSETGYDFNPLYKLVSRPESKKRMSDPNLIYPDDF